MIKYLFVFWLYLLLFKTLNDQCVEWNGIYNIGDKYVKEGSDVCIICICTNDWVNPCNKTVKCEEMKCQNKYLYQILCCQRLGCYGKTPIIDNINKSSNQNLIYIMLGFYVISTIVIIIVLPIIFCRNKCNGGIRISRNDKYFPNVYYYRKYQNIR